MKEKCVEKDKTWWWDNYIGFTVSMLLSVAVLVILFQMNRVNFLFFHVITELVSVVIMWAIFILVWNTRATIDNYAVLFLGVSYFFVGSVDLLHTISYKGMGVLAGNDSNVPTQLWIVSRYIQSVSLLLAPLLLRRRPQPSLVLLCFFGSTVLLVGLVFSGLFPNCLIGGVQLTSFKIGSEYLVVVLLTVSIWAFNKVKKEFDPQILRLIFLSLGASIVSELSFTFYTNIYGLSNFVGHCFKIVAMLFLYKAVIEVGIASPFRLFLYKLKRKDQELGVSEARLRAMFYEHDAVMLQICPETGFIIDANLAAVRFYGYTSEQLLQMKIHEINILPAKEIDHFINSAVKAEKNSFIFSHRIASGEVRVVEVHSTLIPTQETKTLFSIIHDVTEREQAQQELNEFFGQPIVINLIAGMDGQIHRITDGWKTSLGYTQQDLLGKFFIDFVHPDDQAETVNEVLKLEAGKVTLKFENRYRHTDGTYRVLLWSATPSENKQLIYATAIDITEHQKLTEQLQHAQKMESIGTLTGGIAHDFNNILASVIGYTELVLDEELEQDSPARESLGHVLTASNRAADLTKRLLTFSRQSEIDLAPISLNLITQEVLDLLKATVPANITIRTDIVTKSGMVLGDLVQIHQVIMNLCNNAVHAMHNMNGELLLSIEKRTISAKNNTFGNSKILSGKYVELTVTDTGCGIDPQVLDRIFDPFFTTKKAAEGTGLGLSVTHGIIKRIGGYIHVQSRVGEGSIFKLLFPAVEAAQNRNCKIPGAVKPGTETILVVDDEEEIGALYVKMLMKYGYHVYSVSSSLEALEILTQNHGKFDLVVTDQTMPDLTGDQLVKQILNIQPNLPFILCTGYSDTIDKEMAYNIGVTKFLHKPVGKQELLMSIREILDVRRIDI